MMTNLEAINFVEQAAIDGDKNYILTKAAEEFMELALVCLQQVNKPDKDYTKEIHEEGGHAMLRMAQLVKLYGDGPINASFLQKAEYLKHGKEVKKWKNL